MQAQTSGRKKVVTIGGGTGSPVLLSGLNRYARRYDIAAIVTTFDDGGSSGRLRREFGIPALGDIRRCIAALIPDRPSRTDLQDLLEFRFEAASDFENDAFGNLLLLVAMQRFGSLTAAITQLSNALSLNGRVLPVSEDCSTLCAKLTDGSVIRGESNIPKQTSSNAKIADVYLDPPVSANPDALDAINSADLIVLGPGDLYTSVLPNLLPDGVIEALRKSRARIVQVCNLITRDGETEGFHASDFPKAINNLLAAPNSAHLAERKVDAIVVNEYPDVITPVANRVAIDKTLFESVDRVVVDELFDPADPTRHHPAKLAESVVKLLSTGPVND